MGLIYRSFLGSFWGALTLAALLLPGAALLSIGYHKWRRESKGLWRWLHLIYLLIFSLYVEWLGLIAAYWLIFEMEVQAVPPVLVRHFFGSTCSFLWL